MKVLALYTLAPPHLGLGQLGLEFDLSDAAQGLAEALPGAPVIGVQGEPAEILRLLDRHKPDVVFNACEAPLGRPDLEAHVAALLEWTGIRFTGSGSETLALCRRKDRAYAALAARGVRVPPANGLPAIVKPRDEDGSVGIHACSVCHDEPAVASAQARLAGPSLVQAFLPGREFTVALWGRHQPEHHSIAEIVFRAGAQLYSYAAKWDVDSQEFEDCEVCYESEILPELRQSILAASVAAWMTVGARGYLRVDIRLDGEGRPHVLDVNPNPELGPPAGMYWATQEAGWTWERFVRQQIAWA